MKKLECVAFVLLLFSLPAAAKEETLRFGSFGSVTLYHEKPQPARVVLFISGDGGWNLGVVDMARELAALDTLVVGIDITHYLKSFIGSNEKCSYPAGDLEELSKFVQQKLGYSHYVTPVLVGYSSGGTLVYASLVEAPPNTFSGAISLGFCPDLLLAKPLCRGSGLEWGPGPKGKGFSFRPSKTLESPWVALQGEVDQVCDTHATTVYVQQVSRGEIVLLPKVGHGFAVPRNWLPQFKQAFTRLVTENPEALPEPSPDSLKDVPLIEVPADGPGRGDLLAVHLTGDGGWGVTDRGLARALASHGIPVVGLNSLQYFWRRRTPEAAAADLNRILRYYLAAWKKQRAILIGYSFGADVLPFLLNRLPRNTLERIDLVTFLGLGSRAEFEFHFADWLGLGRGSSALVRPEVEKLKEKKMLCFYGAEDADALCRQLQPGIVSAFALKGGHRIGADFEPIAEVILREVGVQASSRESSASPSTTKTPSQNLR